MASATCEFSSRCAVFLGRSVQPEEAMRYRDHYCLEDCSACARWALAIAIGIDEVPDWLLPHQYERADEYIIQAV